MEQISTIDFSKLKGDEQSILLDVRTTEEFELVNIGGIHIPLDEIQARFGELDKNKTIYCLCHHGVRSEYAGSFLRSVGFNNVVNIIGGIHSWSTSVDSSIRTY